MRAASNRFKSKRYGYRVLLKYTKRGQYHYRNINISVDFATRMRSTSGAVYRMKMALFKVTISFVFVRINS